jgi:hypothetical protein
MFAELDEFFLNSVDKKNRKKKVSGSASKRRSTQSGLNAIGCFWQVLSFVCREYIYIFSTFYGEEPYFPIFQARQQAGVLKRTRRTQSTAVWPNYVGHH